MSAFQNIIFLNVLKSTTTKQQILCVSPRKHFCQEEITIQYIELIKKLLKDIYQKRSFQKMVYAYCVNLVGKGCAREYKKCFIKNDHFKSKKVSL